ncbi:MAG: SPOR domain-containing protein [Acidobacteria bacterium]|nr:MAG: SPOR domain-containing protein [Acidobacteriota bacterium]
MRDLRRDGGDRAVEFELDLPRLALLAALAAAGLLGAFWLGRATAPGGGRGDRPIGASAPAPVDGGDVSAGMTLFDREGVGGAAPEPSRQVVPRPVTEGGYEIQVAEVAGRAEAERLRAEVRALGFPALLVRSENGRYRVAAGPFPDRRAAEEAAGRLARKLGRPLQAP